MAAPAVRTKFTIVNIIGTMTAVAAVADSLHRCQRTAVTVVTGDIQMRAVYRETGLRIVIKQPKVPRDRVVAGLTVVLEPARVRIVIKVAVNALGIRASKYFGLVAGFTLEIVVLAQKRKSRQVMIEQRRIVPTLLRVAILASIALLAFVYLVVQVTGGTGCAGRGIEHRFDMAIYAGDGLM